MFFTNFLRRAAICAVLVLGVCSMGCERVDDEMSGDNHLLEEAAGTYRGVLEVGDESIPDFYLQAETLGEFAMRFVADHEIFTGDSVPLYSDCKMLTASWSGRGVSLATDLYETPIKVKITDRTGNWSFVGERLLGLVD